MVISELLKDGGYLLAVGGKLSQLPDTLTKHPRILIWDDEVAGSYLNKTVPSNTRAIVFNRFTSHTLVARLRNAAKTLHIPIFPVPTHREMKELLFDVFQGDTKDVKLVDTGEMGVGAPVKAASSVMPEFTTPQPQPVTSESVTTEDTDMKTFAKGETAAFVTKHGNLHPTEGVTHESERLVRVAREHGYKTTAGAISQQIYKLRGQRPARTTVKTTVKSTAPVKSGDKTLDDLAEFQSLLENAKTAIDLLVEHLPKVVGEVKQSRERIETLRNLLK